MEGLVYTDGEVTNTPGQGGGQKPQGGGWEIIVAMLAIWITQTVRPCRRDRKSTGYANGNARRGRHRAIRGFVK